MSNYNLSSLWRESRSADPGTELAHILGAARVMAQTLIPGIDVAISGMKYAQTDTKTIFLTADGLKGYPVPDNLVDVLLGDVVHEAGHVLFSSADKRVLIRGLWRSKSFMPTEFVSLVDTIEDIYIHTRMSGFPVYREYLKRSIEHYMRGIPEETISRPLMGEPVKQEMINALLYYGIKGTVPQLIAPRNAMALVELLQIASLIATEKVPQTRGVQDMWRILAQFPLKHQPPPTPTPPTKGQEQSEGEKPQKDKDATKEEEDEDEENGEGKGEDESPKEEIDQSPAPQPEPEAPPPDLARAINTPVELKTHLPSNIAKEVTEAIVEQRQDITRMVAALAGESLSNIITYTPPADVDLGRIRASTHTTEEELRRIFQQFRDRHTSNYRGLYAGKISNRRLHRVGYGDERVFQRRERPEEMDLAMVLLMDFSGSMVSSWKLSTEIITALSDAFSKEKAEFMAAGYGGGTSVRLPIFYNREQGLQIGLGKLGGSTPSYEGLAAAASLLLKFGGNRKKVLAHFTDGQPNSGRSMLIPDLLKEIRKLGIKDYHICPKGSNLHSIYGRMLEIADISLLPHMIEDILKKELG